MIKRKIKNIEPADKPFLNQEIPTPPENPFPRFPKPKKPAPPDPLDFKIDPRSPKEIINAYANTALEIKFPFVNGHEPFDDWLGEKRVDHGVGDFNLKNLGPSISLGPTILPSGSFRNGDRFDNSITKFSNNDGNFIRIKQWNDFNPLIKPFAEIVLDRNIITMGKMNISYRNEKVEVFEGGRSGKPDKVYRTHNVTMHISSNPFYTPNGLGQTSEVKNDFYYSKNFSLGNGASPYQNTGDRIVITNKRMGRYQTTGAIEYTQHGLELGIQNEPGMMGQKPYNKAYAEYSFSYLTDGPLDDIHRTEFGFNFGYELPYRNDNVNVTDQLYSSVILRVPVKGNKKPERSFEDMNAEEAVEHIFGDFYTTPYKSTQRASLVLEGAVSAPTGNINDITLDRVAMKVLMPILSPESSLSIGIHVTNVDLDKLNTLKDTRQMDGVFQPNINLTFTRGF